LNELLDGSLAICASELLYAGTQTKIDGDARNDKPRQAEQEPKAEVTYVGVQDLGEASYAFQSAGPPSNYLIGDFSVLVEVVNAGKNYGHSVIINHCGLRDLYAHPKSLPLSDNTAEQAEACYGKEGKENDQQGGDILFHAI
jgi:hypothetical protein